MKKINFNIILEVLVYLLGLFISLKILLFPLIGPISVASDIQYTQSNFYEQIIGKSNALLETALSTDEDEEKKGLSSMIFKYVTGIDLSNPQTYIASQIPLLELIDITTLVGGSDEPVVVTPTDSSQNTDKPSEPPPNTNNPGGTTNPAPPKNIDISKPLVLIYHTHTTECYNPTGAKNGNYSTDLNIGVAKVGSQLESILENTYGISTIHDMTIHDLPSRAMAYSKSRPTVESYLKKYPSLKIIIDLHRDGNVPYNQSTAIINNQKYARTMFVIGNNHKNSNKNSAFVKQLNDAMNKLYPGFSRGISVAKTSKYNQDLSPNAILIEVGSNGNSLQEAVNTSSIIAKVIANNIK